MTADLKPIVAARARKRPPVMAAPAEAPSPAPAPAPTGGTTAAEIMAKVNKLHGPNIIRPASALVQFRHLPTNVLTLDMGLLGGIPESLVTMVYGWSGGGKTTTAMRVVASAQAKYPDRKVAVIDAEGTWDNLWARRHGVDPDRILLVQPDTGEQAVDIACELLHARDVSLVVVDSIPALVPMKELDASAEDHHVAAEAKLIKHFVRKATSALIAERKEGHTPSLLLINQWRNKITMMGDPRSLPGGNTLHYFCSVKFEVKNKEVLGVDEWGMETVDFNEHSWKIEKNKLGTSLRTGVWRMVRNPSNPLGPGYVDDAKIAVGFGKKFGLVTGGGSVRRVEGVSLKFGKDEEIYPYWHEHPADFAAFKNKLISIQRSHSGLAADGWL